RRDQPPRAPAAGPLARGDLLGLAPPHLAGDAHREWGGVEGGDRVAAAPPVQHRRPGGRGVEAERGDRSDPGDEDALHGPPRVAGGPGETVRRRGWAVAVSQPGRVRSSSSHPARSLISPSTAAVMVLSKGTSWWIASTRRTPALRSAVASSFPTSPA